MRDIKLHLNGENDTFIDLTKSVDQHDTLAQTCLALSVVGLGSDHLFPDKGTNLVAGTNNINIVNSNYSAHLGNFAALNILRFLNTHSEQDSDKLQVIDIDMGLVPQSLSDNLKFYQVVKFSDGTSTRQFKNI